MYPMLKVILVAVARSTLNIVHVDVHKNIDVKIQESLIYTQNRKPNWGERSVQLASKMRPDTG